MLVRWREIFNHPVPLTQAGLEPAQHEVCPLFPPLLAVKMTFHRRSRHVFS
jgi:hypothetical protein